MKTFHLSFIGRLKGALGVTTPVLLTIDADTYREAVQRVYETHEHISQMLDATRTVEARRR